MSHAWLRALTWWAVVFFVFVLMHAVVRRGEGADGLASSTNLAAIAACQLLLVVVLRLDARGRAGRSS